MKSSATLLLCLFICTGAYGQTALWSDTSEVSLTYGSFATNFTYGDTLAAANYNFEESISTLMLSWESGALSAGYGGREPDSATGRPGLRIINATVWTGGNAVLFEEFFRLPIQAFVPIRLNLDYRYLAAEREEADEMGVDNLNTLHLLGAGIGVGGGVQVRFPFGPDIIQNHLLVRGAYLIAPGVIGNLGEAIEEDNPEETLRKLKLRRATDFSIDILFTDLFEEDGLGVTLGYTYRTVHRSPESPDAFGDIVDALINADDYRRLSTRSILRIGVNW